MQNLAYKIDTLPDISACDWPNSRARNDACAACGEPLFGSDAKSYSWQGRASFWEMMGTSSVELVCRACGEYLQNFFKTWD